MTTSSVVAFALVMLILIVHIMQVCPFSTGLCKQYGHSCLGGHGKRSENQNTRLLKHLLRELYENSKQDLMPSKEPTDPKEWESSPFEKKPISWDVNPEDSLSENFFNE